MLTTLRAALLGCVCGSALGCGFMIQSPPPDHEQLTSLSCTESNLGPVLDAAWATLNVVGAFMIASDRGAYENPDEAIIVGFGWGIVSGTAAALGFSKTKRCRETQRRVAERRRRREFTERIERAAQGVQAAHVPPGSPEVRAVVITPGRDTLVVGQRLQLRAAAQAAGGAEIRGAEFSWWSSDPFIASVGAAGLVEAHRPGTARINAGVGLPAGSAYIVVIAAP